MAQMAYFRGKRTLFRGKRTLLGVPPQIGPLPLLAPWGPYPQYLTKSLGIPRVF